MHRFDPLSTRSSARPSCKIFEPHADFDRLLNAEAKSSSFAETLAVQSFAEGGPFYAEPKDVDPERQLGARRQLSG
jgi:hypothetical protein